MWDRRTERAILSYGQQQLAITNEQIVAGHRKVENDAALKKG
jgi:hypothetical protein